MKNFFLFLLLLSSCSDRIKTLPSSTGSLSEVIFVVEDILWEQEISTLVNKTFGAPIQGINQDEANYKVIQINHSEFKNILKKHKHIIIVGYNISESSQQNIWAKQQLVVQLNWEENIEETLDKLAKVKSIFDVNEIKTLRSKTLKFSNKIAEKKIKENFKINVVIPDEYAIIENNSSLFWATYNPPKKEEIKQILIFSFKPETNNLQHEVLEKTDSLFSIYLLGSPKNSFVKIEPLYPPYFKNNIYKGLWKLENGFMGGPFLIKTYFVKDELIVVSGVIFAPQSKKRNHMKMLEAIL